MGCVLRLQLKPSNVLEDPLSVFKEYFIVGIGFGVNVAEAIKLDFDRVDLKVHYNSPPAPLSRIFEHVLAHSDVVDGEVKPLEQFGVR